MVGLVIRLTEHAKDCIVTGPVIYEYPSLEVAEHCMLKFFRGGIVSTLDEYVEWHETLCHEEHFDILPLHNYVR